MCVCMRFFSNDDRIINAIMYVNLIVNRCCRDDGKRKLNGNPKTS